MHPVVIPVEAVASSVDPALIAAAEGSARADHVLAGGVRKKDFSNGRERIRRLSIARELPLLPGCVPLGGIGVPLCEIGGIADLFIGIGGISHARHCPMHNGELRIRIYSVLDDHIRRTWQRKSQ